MMKNVTIYTDGACSGNPGIGGWGAILIYGQHNKSISGASAETTNNRMEMMAVIQALRLLKEPCIISIYSDSAYLVNAFNKQWIDRWQKNGWQTSTKKPVENKDLWQELLGFFNEHQITFHKVEGHSDDAYNNQCDALATGAIKQYKKKIKDNQ